MPIDLKIFSPENWNYQLTRNFAFFQRYLDAVGFTYGADSWKVPPLEELWISEGTRCAIFDTKISDEKVLDFLITESIKDPYGFLGKNLKQKFLDRGEQFLKIAYELNKIKEISDKNDLIKKLDQYCESHIALSLGLMITSMLNWDLSRLAPIIAKEELKNIDPSEIDANINILVTPDEETPAFKQEIAVLELSSWIQEEMKKTRNNFNSILSGTPFKEKLNQLMNDSAWITVNFIDEPIPEPKFIEDIKKYINNGDCQEQITAKKTHRKEILSQRDKLFGDLPMSEKLKNIILAMRLGTVLAEYRKSIFSHVGFLVRPFFDTIAKILDLENWQQVYCLSPEEIKDGILGKVSLEGLKTKYQQRKNGYNLILSVEYGIRELVQEEIDYVKSNFDQFKKETEKIDTITGQIGAKGKIRGIARLILSTAEMNKMEKGEILIAQSTTVDFVPVMRLAGAIVTDEGGLTCHAAIIARELKKPCIIGTKNATKVIKDGDLVEVDADRGVVKILKSEKEN
ncbi:MAG: PEP-utilizing enzyme [Candidatus Paceibacterota bacterium]|jgi:phosphohistidine swiveling domain-containing protein